MWDLGTFSGQHRDYEMRTKRRRRHTIELLYNVLMPNLSLVLRISSRACVLGDQMCFAQLPYAIIRVMQFKL